MLVTALHSSKPKPKTKRDREEATDEEDEEDSADDVEEGGDVRDDGGEGGDADGTAADSDAGVGAAGDEEDDEEEEEEEEEEKDDDEEEEESTEESEEESGTEEKDGNTDGSSTVGAKTPAKSSKPGAKATPKKRSSMATDESHDEPPSQHVPKQSLTAPKPNRKRPAEGEAAGAAGRSKAAKLTTATKHKANTEPTGEAPTNKKIKTTDGTPNPVRAPKDASKADKAAAGKKGKAAAAVAREAAKPAAARTSQSETVAAAKVRFLTPGCVVHAVGGAHHNPICRVRAAL